MSQRSTLTSLPPDLLDELNVKLIDSAFSDYTGLTEWLRLCGYEISRSAVHRHGSALQAKMTQSLARARERMEIAKALRGASDEDKAALMEANEMVAMDQIMDMFESISTLEQREKVIAVPKLVRAIADLNRAAVGSAKWKRDFEDTAKREAREEAASLAAKAAKAEGVSETGIFRIRHALGFDAHG